MIDEIMIHYVKLTKFLGQVLGPDYEIALHDTSDPNNSIIAIANGHISGRTIGAPLTEKSKQALLEKDYISSDFNSNYTGIVVEDGKMLRTSVLYIKNNQDNLIGILCINFDDSRYKELSDQILQLRHPDTFVKTHFVYNKDKARLESVPGNAAENFQESVNIAAETTISQIVEQSGVPVDRLTAEEKIQIVSILYEQGVFLMKNAVSLVSEQLKCSQATIYRYLNKVQHNN